MLSGTSATLGLFHAQILSVQTIYNKQILVEAEYDNNQNNNNSNNNILL